MAKSLAGQIIYSPDVVAASNGNCGLVMNSSGKIFGFASGLFEPATVFELSLNGSSWTPTILYTFRSLRSYPIGALVLDKAGNIYGTMSAGSSSSLGAAPMTRNCYGRSAAEMGPIPALPSSWIPAATSSARRAPEAATTNATPKRAAEMPSRSCATTDPLARVLLLSTSDNPRLGSLVECRA